MVIDLHGTPCPETAHRRYRGRPDRCSLEGVLPEILAQSGLLARLPPIP
jgi:hypothetical protein